MRSIEQVFKVPQKLTQKCLTALELYYLFYGSKIITVPMSLMLTIDIRQKNIKEARLYLNVKNLALLNKLKLVLSNWKIQNMSDVEDETTPTESTYKPSFVLIAIDTDASMFVKREQTGTTPFKDCISACYELSNSLIFTQNKKSWSPFGIVLAREDANASLVDFGANVLESIKKLKELNDSKENELQQLYERTTPIDLSDFFLLCKKKFREVKSAFYKRIVIYVTSDDNPVKGDNQKRFAALNEAKNFQPNNIQFEVITMNGSFDYSLFYNELFSITSAPAVETYIEDQGGLLDKLTSTVVVKYYKRTLSFYPFLGDIKRSIQIYQKSYIAEEKLYNNAFVSRDGKPLKKVSAKVDNVEMPKIAIPKAPHIEFTIEEKAKIEGTEYPIGYTLVHVSKRVTHIGTPFLSKKIMDLHHKEDPKFFNNFWQFCVDNDKVLICISKLRQNDRIRFVELVPKFMNNTKVFLINIIPYNDNLKPLPTLPIGPKIESRSPSQSGDLSEKIKIINLIIDKLSTDYSPKMFVNTQMTKKKAFLRSKLLDEELEEIEDVTENSKEIDNRITDLVVRFKDVFQWSEDTGKKRKAPAKPRGGSKKKK